MTEQDSQDSTVLAVEHLTVRARTAQRSLINDVSLSLKAGECLGIVGESGSGKSLTLRSVVGLVPPGLSMSGSFQLADPATGELATYDAFAVRGDRIGVVFQDPMRASNPIFTVRKTLREPLRQHLGMSKEEADARIVGLLDEVGIPNPSRVMLAYPHQLSGGLRQRVMIAAALAAEPEILLCDEPTTALDVTTQGRILDLILSLRATRGLSVVFVTHDLAVVSKVADRIAVMYAGQLLEHGRAADVLGHPAHPYAQGLLASVPTRIKSGERFRAIAGKPLSPAENPAGCVFEPRCSVARDECRRRSVAMRDIDSQHAARCVMVTPGRSAPAESEV